MIVSEEEEMWGRDRKRGGGDDVRMTVAVLVSEDREDRKWEGGDVRMAVAEIVPSPRWEIFETPFCLFATSPCWWELVDRLGFMRFSPQ